MRELKVEKIKFQNSLSMYVLIFSPFVFLLFAIFTSLFAQSSPNQHDLSPYLSILFNLWPYFVIPVVIVIACNSSINIEKRNQLFNYYKSNNWSLNLMIKNKIRITTIGFLIHTLIIFVIALIGNALVGGSAINTFLLFNTIILIFIGSIPLIPINFLMVRYFGVFISIFLNILLSILGIIALTTSHLFWILPWSYLGRIPMITLALHPNGTTISKSSPYFNDLTTLLIILIVSVIYFVIFYFINNQKSWRLK